jgi:hypothetical protein
MSRFAAALVLTTCCVALVWPSIGPAQTPDTPEQLWVFQGIEDICAMATLPDVDGDGVPDVLVETYDAGADGDHLYLLSGGSDDPPTVIWSARPGGGVSNGGGYGDECLAVSPDLSGDGFPDVLLGTAWGNRSVHALDGLDGTLLWSFDTYDEPESGWVYAVRPHFDRTGDGKPEIIFGAGSDNDTGYLLDGADGSVIWRFFGSTDAIGHVVALPDVEGDDGPDVLFCGWDFETRVFCVSSAGNGTPRFIWDTDTGASNHTATLVDDVSGDGIADVVVGNWDSSQQVICLDSVDGSVLWTFHNGSYNYIMRLVNLGDVDDDGVADIAVGSWDRAVRVVSGATGDLIWQSYAGSFNGGDFWAVDRVDDVTGDGRAEVVGGSFDTYVYLFDGAKGDTLWTFDTPNRLKSVRGTADLSGNGRADVLGGTQYLSGGGRAYALEGAEAAVPVDDLPQVAGRSGWLPGSAPDARDVELRWSSDAPVAFRVYRVVAQDEKGGAGGAAAVAKAELAVAFARGELTTREVLARRQQAAAKSAPVLLTPQPLAPEAQRAGSWHYRLVDAGAPSRASYRVAVVLADGSDRTLLELTPSATFELPPLLLSADVAPNPFNPRTAVRFDLDRPAAVSLAVFDVAGRRVFARAPERLAAGRRELPWDGRGFGGRELPAGVYLLRLTADGESRVVRAALVR